MREMFEYEMFHVYTPKMFFLIVFSDCLIDIIDKHTERLRFRWLNWLKQESASRLFLFNLFI